MQKTYTLVYQGGIANVFRHVPNQSLGIEENEPKGSSRERLFQGDFKSCENYCRGLIEAGGVVRRAWANVAGDVALVNWSFSNLENAPFSAKFSEDLV